MKAVIFDMDGVVIDSNHIIYENWQEVFKKRFDVDLDKKEFSLQLGKNGKDFLQYFIERHKLDANHEEVVEELVENYFKKSHKVELKEGIKEILPEISKNYKIALATGAHRRFANDILNRFEIGKYFDYVIAGNQVKEAKPNPDIFLKCANNLNVEPKDCIVIEDARMGLLAAKKAGMKCVMLEDEFTRHQDHSLADYKVDNLNQLLNILEEIKNG